MTSKLIWRPDASYAAGSEEGGRGSLQDPDPSSSSEQVQDAKGKAKSKRVVIPRRRTPTVSIPPPAVSRESSEDHTPSSPKPPVIYATIEKNKKHSLLELSHREYDKLKPANLPWFCGWTDREVADLHKKPPPTHTTGEGDRTRLQTPMDGHRSSLHSRASSSRYSSSQGRRRMHYQYTFHHYETSAEYAEEYRQLYGFTALSTGNPQRDEEERLYCEGEDVEQDAEVLFPLGVKSLYKGDPFIRELASRLGMKDPPLEDWERQQLLACPRPTPPSIVKRKRNGKDQVEIMVSNSSPKWYDAQSEEGRSTDARKESNPVASEATRKFGVVELPKISHATQISDLLKQVHRGNNSSKRSSNSVISVKNYLQVKSKNQETLVEEEEEEGEGEEGDSSDQEAADNQLGLSKSTRKTAQQRESDKLASPQPSPVDDASKITGERSREAYKDGREAKNRGDDSKGTERAKHRLQNALADEHSLMLSQGQKERLITNTAHTLGVVSRDWARIPGRMKLMRADKGNNPGAAAKVDRQVSAPGGSSKHHGRNKNGMGHGNETAAPASRREPEVVRTATVHRQRSGDEKKIEKLKSIYDAGGQQPRKRGSKSLYSSRQPSRCHSRHPSRPVTRMNADRALRHLEIQGGGQVHPSRPVTRIGDAAPSRPITRMGGSQRNRVTNLANLEESTYWNELTQDDTNPVSGKGHRARGDNNAASGGGHQMRGDSNAAAVFGVMDTARVLEDLRRAGASRRTTVRTGWNEDLSALVGPVRGRDVGGKGGVSLMAGDEQGDSRGKEANRDKIAQAIALAMKFRQPRESLMRKLTGGGNRSKGSEGETAKLKHNHTMVAGGTGPV